MRKIIIVLSIIILSSCSFFDTTSYIKFENELSDFVFAYGFRFGEAVYNGELWPNTSTEFYEITAGSYDLEIKTSTGIYFTPFSNKVPIERGSRYTLLFGGEYDAVTDNLDLEMFLEKE